MNDLEILENFILKDNETYTEQGVRATMGIEEIQALSNVLERVKKLENLLIDNETKDELILKLEAGDVFTEKQARYIEVNFVAKQKIEEKIEEWDKSIK